MKRFFGPIALIAAGLVGGLAMAPRLAAQSPAAAAVPGSAKLAGSWTGTYTTDGPSGTMELTVTQEGAAWKVVTALGGEAPPAGEIREVQVSGDTLSWKQIFGEYDVTFKATLSSDGAQLGGTLDATQGGASVGGGSFSLARKQ